MEKIFQIYLTKKYVTSKEWEELIKAISNYNGLFKKWSIIVINNNNHINYYIKTKAKLPASINNLNSFLLKEVEEEISINPGISRLFYNSMVKNIIDIINYSNIRNKGEVKYFYITFFKIGNDNIKSKCYFYIEKLNKVKKYLIILKNIYNLLEVDFEGNKRYFYKGVPSYLDISKVTNILDSSFNDNSLIRVDTFPYLGGDFYLGGNNYSFNKHSLIVGSSGSGKSKFISLFINNINKNEELKNKYRVVVIDPHASLENDIGGISRVIDFKKKIDSIDLFSNNSEDIVINVELMLELLKSLMGEQYNSKLERVLRHAIYILLTDGSFSFKSLRKILLELEYRNNLIKSNRYKLPVSVIQFFLTDFNELKTKFYGEAISPIIALIDEMEMVPVFNESTIDNNLVNTISNNFLTLFSLDRIKLGDKVTKTIAGLIMQQLLNIMQSKLIDKHIIFIIDEVAVVENPILARFLSEARKYNLSLILAGQYFNQISDSLKTSIFANVINYYIFRVSKMDASLLVDNFEIKIPIDNSRDKKIKLLTELNNRECIVRIEVGGKLMPAIKGSTINYTSIPRIKDNSLDISTNSDNKEKKRISFEIGNNISLKNILKANSSSRKEIK